MVAQNCWYILLALQIQKLMASKRMSGNVVYFTLCLSLSLALSSIDRQGKIDDSLVPLDGRFWVTDRIARERSRFAALNGGHLRFFSHEWRL